MEKKCAVPTFYLYGSGDDGTYDAYSRPDDDGEWCHIDDVTAELARLRAENERLRQLGTEIRNRLKNHARTLDLDDWALASIRACDAWDSALAALDQERKEGDR